MFERWELDEFILIVSNHLLKEYESVLQKSKFRKYKVKKKYLSHYLTNIERYSEFVGTDDLKPFTIRDPKDKFVLETAISGKADYVVTGDKDLLVLDGAKKLGKLRIVTVNEFIEKY